MVAFWKLNTEGVTVAPTVTSKAISPQDTIFNIIGIAKAKPINKEKSPIMPVKSNKSLFRPGHTLQQQNWQQGISASFSNCIKL